MEEVNVSPEPVFSVLCLFQSNGVFPQAGQSGWSGCWKASGGSWSHSRSWQIPSQTLAYLSATLLCPLPAIVTVNQSLWVSWTLQRSMCVNGCKKKRKKNPTSLDWASLTSFEPSPTHTAGCTFVDSAGTLCPHKLLPETLRNKLGQCTKWQRKTNMAPRNWVREQSWLGPLTSSLPCVAMEEQLPLIWRSL